MFSRHNHDSVLDHRANRKGVYAMRALLLGLALVGVGLLGQATHVTPAHAAGNADAAHACQQGGYLNLTGSDGTTFSNEGDCVSYAAHGGQFTTPVPVCTVTATTGCVTLNNAVFASTAGDGSTMTLTGATSFDTSCAYGIYSRCTYPLPNTLAMGGGTYIQQSSTGQVTAQGIYRIADTTGSTEGLATDGFSATGSGGYAGTPCTTAGERTVEVQATFIDSHTQATSTLDIFVGTGQGSSGSGSISIQSVGALFIASSLPLDAITC
jgi:hypothetical protein